MGTSPFIKSPFSRQSGFNRRRSTRIEHIVPVILSGRDAKGEAFREESQTKIVNLHGAKLWTSREILIGMQVCVENPQNAAAEKGVCVRIEEDIPGTNLHYIAIQLVRPGNIWGISNPPADWAMVAANLLGRPSEPPPVVPSGPPAALPADSVAPIIESQAVTLEQQSAELVESTLQIVRRQVEVLTAAMLQDFEKKLQILEQAAGERIEQRAGKALAEITTLVEAMQEDMATDIAAHGNAAVNAAETDLRAKVSEILAPLMGVTANVSPAKPTGTFPRK